MTSVLTHFTRLLVKKTKAVVFSVRESSLCNEGPEGEVELTD